MAKAEKETITIKPVDTKSAVITIAGDTDLIINQMGATTKRDLIEKQEGKKKSKAETVNKWENIITSVHWLNPLDSNIRPKDYSESMLNDLLKNNTPCISAFGLMKQLGKAVTRYGIDTYSTKFNAAVNIITPVRDMIPISYTTYTLQTDLIPAKKGSPVISYHNTFSGWKADIHIDYVDNMFNLNEIVNVFYLLGWGIGIGSGTSSGYGKFHVENVK